MIDLDTGPCLRSRHTNPWPADDHQTDQNDLYVANSRRHRQKSVPNGCFHLDRLGILVPCDCRTACLPNPLDRRCTVLCCCFLRPAWAQTPMSHRLGHRCPVVLLPEQLLGRGLLAGLQPWHRRVEPVRRPERTHQYHVVSHVLPHGTAHSSCPYQLVVEPLNDPISTFLSLELNLSDHNWMGLDDPALADEPTDGHHRTLKVASGCAGR